MPFFPHQEAQVWRETLNLKVHTAKPVKLVRATTENGVNECKVKPFLFLTHTSLWMAQAMDYEGSINYCKMLDYET